MKMITELPLALLKLLCVAAALLPAMSTSASGPATMPTPHWRVGDWWEFETWHIGRDWQPTALGRVRLTVLGQDKVAGHPVWKVSFAPIPVLHAPAEYCYALEDLSLVRFKESRAPFTHLRSPGAPAWSGTWPRLWNVFPLVDGQSLSVKADQRCMRSSSGATEEIPLSQQVWYKNNAVPGQSVSLDTIQWAEGAAKVFTVRLHPGPLRPGDNTAAVLRWSADEDLGYPLQGWQSGTSTEEAFRLVDCSRGMKVKPPRPVYRKFRFVEDDVIGPKTNGSGNGGKAGRTSDRGAGGRNGSGTRPGSSGSGGGGKKPIIVKP
jgi:hypothetical protein